MSISAIPTHAGAVTLTDNSDNAIVSNGAAATLNVDDNTISGAGTIGDAQPHPQHQPGGIVDATGTNPLILDTGSNTISNVGMLEATDGATLEIDSNVDNAGGTIAAHGAGSLVQLSGVTIAGGELVTDSLSASSGGVIAVVADGGVDTVFDGSGGIR